MTKPATVALSEFDFMELVVFDRKVDSDGFRYAAENYPPVFERDGYTRYSYDTREEREVLHELRREYSNRIDEFWEREDAVDQHNAHVGEAARRELARELSIQSWVDLRNTRAELDAAYVAMDAARDRVAALERVAGEVPRLTYGKPAWVREGDHEFLLVRVSADQYAALLAALDAVPAADTTTGDA